MKTNLLGSLLVLLVALIILMSACSSPPAPTSAPTVKPSATASAPVSATPPVASQPATATINLKAGASLANTSSQTQTAQWWIDEVTKRSNGQVKFQTFWGGTMVQKGEELNATQKGVIDVGVIVSTYFPDELPLFGWDYTFMFSPTDPQIAAKLAAKVMDRSEVRNGIEKYNLKVLAPIFLAPYGYNGTKPFKTIDDLKGVKVSVAGTEMPKWVQAAGGVPVVMTAPEKYMALQTGVTGGSLLSTDSIFSYKLHEVGKYVTTTDLGSPIGSAICINKDSFNKLPADIQKIMVDVASEVGNFNAQNVKKAYDAALKGMEAGGATITPFPYEEKVRWANVAPNLPAQWAKKMDAKGMPGTALVNYYLQAATELGYKWPREWKVE